MDFSLSLAFRSQLERLRKSRIRSRWLLQQLQQKRSVAYRQFNNSLTLDDTLSLAQRGLNNELIQWRTNEVRRVLKGVLHVLRQSDCNSAH